MHTYPLGSLIRFHRKRAELSGAALAALAGVSKNAVYELEQGKATVQWDTLLKIISTLNINITFQSPLMHEFESQPHAKS
ncbi:MAG: helix-turn-helix domain-containing protein [Bacteroidota bacterium]